MIMSRQASAKLERFLETEIERFLIGEGWSIDVACGDHIATTWESGGEVSINVTRCAAHIAEQSSV